MKDKKKKGNPFLAILGMCVFAFAIVFAFQYLIGYILIWTVGRTALSQPLWSAIYSALVYIFSMIVIIGLPIMIKEKKCGKKPKKEEVRKELGLKELPTWTDVGLAPVGFFVSLILAAILVGIFNVFPWFNATEVQDYGFSHFLTPGLDRVIAFLTLVVVAPIAEEIIFRGWLYGKIRERLNDKLSEIWGIIVSSLVVSVLFGLIHLQWNVGVNVFALSIVLCALREVTGTIYAGILTHMIKNGVAFYLIYVLGVV